jgi:hypothetical protein
MCVLCAKPLAPGGGDDLGSDGALKASAWRAEFAIQMQQTLHSSFTQCTQGNVASRLCPGAEGRS